MLWNGTPSGAIAVRRRNLEGFKRMTCPVWVERDNLYSLDLWTLSSAAHTLLSCSCH